MKKFILWLIRKKLGLKKHETFRFANQVSSDVYYFGDDIIVKMVHGNPRLATRAGVSLNWLLDDECEIVKI